MIFLFTSILAVTSFAITFMVNEPVCNAPAQGQADPVKGFHVSNYLERKAIPISIIIFFIGFCYSGVITFISLYSKEIHLGGAASFYFLVYAVTVFFTRPFSGRLFDMKGANYVAYPCLFIFMLGMLLFSQTHHGITLLLSGALMGLGYGNFISCANAVSIKDIPPRRLGLATSTFFVFVDLGFGLGPYLLGLLIPYTGYRGLYFTLAMLILTTIPLYYFLPGRKALK